jgi:DNA-directed RNA polymerase subunit RPC12/RpoP
MSDWIDPRTHRPQSGQTVLCARFAGYPKSCIQTALYVENRYDTFWHTGGDYGRLTTDCIIGWMPLPRPPSHDEYVARTSYPCVYCETVFAPYLTIDGSLEDIECRQCAARGKEVPS